MLEHLVEGHLGGYYISDGDPEFIEMYCETCGDSDSIVASWNQFEENGRLNGLLKYFTMDVLNNREDIDCKVDEYNEGPVEVEDIIPSILNDIEYNDDYACSILTSLYEDHEIREDEYRKIMKILDFEEERQLKMVKHFANDIFAKDDNGKVKVLKLSNKR